MAIIGMYMMGNFAIAIYRQSRVGPLKNRTLQIMHVGKSIFHQPGAISAGAIADGAIGDNGLIVRYSRHRFGYRFIRMNPSGVMQMADFILYSRTHIQQ